MLCLCSVAPMTLEEINKIPATPVSTTPDTEAICFWLKEIWTQQVRMNELLEQLIKLRV